MAGFNERLFCDKEGNKSSDTEIPHFCLVH
jgi:hypothetical protein